MDFITGMYRDEINRLKADLIICEQSGSIHEKQINSYQEFLKFKNVDVSA